MVTIGSSAVEERAGGSGRSGGLGEAARGAAALTARWAHRHSDHEEERCDKAAAHQSVMRPRLIEVECTGDGHNSFEMRRSFHCSFRLRSSEITDPRTDEMGVSHYFLI